MLRWGLAACLLLVVGILVLLTQTGMPCEPETSLHKSARSYCEETLTGHDAIACCTNRVLDVFDGATVWQLANGVAESSDTSRAEAIAEDCAGKPP